MYQIISLPSLPPRHVSSKEMISGWHIQRVIDACQGFSLFVMWRKIVALHSLHFPTLCDRHYVAIGSHGGAGRLCAECGFLTSRSDPK